VPPGVVTRHLLSGYPVAGTVAVICVGELTVKVALTNLSVTDVAPVKFVPVIVTVEPTGPLVGEKLVIVGAGVTLVTVNVAVLVAVPPGAVTLHFPLAAPEGTETVIFVAELTVNDALREPSFTAVAPVKFVPLIVTEVPTGPLVGVKLETVGGAGAAVM
jgi:hypothetical protein